MSDPKRSGEFDFLTHSGRRDIRLTEIICERTKFNTNDEYMNCLEEEGGRIYISDITIPEVAEAGLFVTKVIIPEFMPFSCVHKARYLATKRLSDVSRTELKTDLHESNINHMPQPFA